MDHNDWTFPTLAHVWEYRNRAIVTAGDRLDAMEGGDRERSLTALTQRVRDMVEHLDDGVLLMTGFWMVEDLYKSFFREFVWSPGVHDYIAATAGAVTDEIARRDYALDYVVDSTQGAANLAGMLAYLPEVFRIAGFVVVGPQLVAMELLVRAQGKPPEDITEVQRYREEGHAVADEVITRCHRERRSSVYLNIDFDDDLPGLALDTALAADGLPGTCLVFRRTPPAEGTSAYFSPPPGVSMPPVD